VLHASESHTKYLFMLCMLVHLYISLCIEKREGRWLWENSIVKTTISFFTPLLLIDLSPHQIGNQSMGLIFNEIELPASDKISVCRAW